MQPIRRRAGGWGTLNLVHRSSSYNVNPVCDYCSVRKCAASCKSAGCDGILESLKRWLSGTDRVWKTGQHFEGSVSITYTNPLNSVFDGGHGLIVGPFVEIDKLSTARATRATRIKFVRTGAVTTEFFWKCTSKADARGGFNLLVVDYNGARVRNLHTEVKVEKYGDEKSEEVATVRKVKSTVIENAPTKKRGPRIGRILSTTTSGKNTADLQVPNHASVLDNESDRLSTKSPESGIESQVEGDNEVVIAAAHVSAESHDDDDEEAEDFSEAAGNKLQVQELTGKDADEIRSRSSAQAMALLRAALDEADEVDGKVAEEFQRSLRVGIVGAPNAGKSLLTNQLVGTRVSAVSRKTNTTHREHLGVFTKGDTQLLYFDTPGLHLNIEGSPLRVDTQHRVQNAWEIVDFCEALVVLVDAERQIRRPDKRVQRLVERLGAEKEVSQKRVLCLNKVDIIEQKRLLLPLAKQFEDLLGYDRIFMISGLTGSGVKDVTDYLLNQAVLRPWDEDPELTNYRDIALEVVREQIFELLHEELPHTTKQKLVSWKVLKDGSIRIQQLLLVAKKEHHKILVGKNGAVIGEIGIKARKELQEILGVTVHLVLDVTHMTGMLTGDE